MSDRDSTGRNAHPTLEFSLDRALVDSKRNLVQITKLRIANVAIIGRDDGSTFRDVLQMLRHNDQVRVISEHQTLLAALEAGLGKTMSADLVIILQLCSDEFAQHEINDLIGRCLFGRILCCYGPWCTADGRSHELWPVAFRIPAASAASLVELELLSFKADTQALFPMSAGEEVFAHRSQFPDDIAPTVRTKAIVISDDSDLRTTVAGILKAMNCDCTNLPLSVAAIRSHLATQDDGIRLAIIDLDGTNDVVEKCIDVLHAEGRITTSVGMSVFSAAQENSATRAESRLAQIMEKTELLLQLRSLLKQR